MTSIDGPGFSIPVHGPDHWPDAPIRLVVVLAWRYAEAILAKHGNRIPEGAPIVALLPDLTVVRARSAS